MNIWDVFISHASEEHEILQPIVQKLESKFFVWYDADQILTGENFEKVVEFGLKYSSFAILFFSPYYFLKDFPQKELDSLINKYPKKIFPVAYKISVETVKRKVPSLNGHKILEINDIEKLKINQLINPINIALKEKVPIEQLVDHDDIDNIMIDDFDFNDELISHPNTKVVQNGKIWEKCIEFSNDQKKFRIKSCAYCYPSVDDAITDFQNNFDHEVQFQEDGRIYDPNVGEQQYGRRSLGDDKKNNGGLVVFRTTNILARVEYYTPQDYRYNFHQSEKYARIIDKKIRFLISKRLLD